MSDKGEFPRDLSETAFTPVLRTVLHCHQCVLGVVFVDGEGECVDCVSSMDPFEIKLAGAQWHHTLSQLSPQLERGGAVHSVFVATEERCFVIRRVSDEYGLVVVTRTDVDLPAVAESLDGAVRAVRFEGGVQTPDWDPQGEAVRVVLRAAQGWAYAPAAYWEREERTDIDAVLGRWEEGQHRVCFRVRTSGGDEVTLIRHRDREEWVRK